VRIVDRFTIPYYQYLNEDSLLADMPPALAKDNAMLALLYQRLLLVRTMDAKAVALQRTGKLGTYPSTRGQEAVFVGVGSALDKDDIFIPYYRDMGAMIQRGVMLSEILQYWGGDERGNCFSHSHDFPYSVPVGSQPLHAVGVAYAMKYRRQKQAVLVMCGDGATSQGDFYEALNVAGAWDLPVVFVVCNNQWAISVPRQAQTKANTLAQKAIAAGIAGEQIDGNDIIAVYDRTQMALAQAREKHEPSLLEMICYRQHDHTTADDASRYEPKQNREAEWKKEPVMRLRRYLEKIGAWDEAKEADLLKNCTEQVESAVKTYLSVPPQSPVAMFDYLYETLPHAYWSQRDKMLDSEGASHE
jgi:pyruvate dehydrogenase E1 component alpha subunit